MAPMTDEEFATWQENISTLQGKVTGWSETIQQIQSRLDSLPDNSPKVTELEKLLQTTQANLEAAETRLAELEKLQKANPSPGSDADDRPVPPTPQPPAKPKVKWT